MKRRHSYVSVDLDAIRHNYRYLQKSVPNSQCIAVIKANAYGHGAIQVAQALSDKSQIYADAFAVATVPEALELRQANIKQKIIVLGGFIDEQELFSALKYGLDCVVHSQYQIDLLLKADCTTINIWLKVNSGMGRLGFNLHEVPAAIQQLSAFSIVSIMTHLASADNVHDDKTQQQIKAIKSLKLDQYDWSISNSAGTLGWENIHQQWVRFGIALYGINPFNQQNKAAQNLQPAMKFSSQIVAIYQRQKGDTVGYGATYTCPQNMRIGVIGAGYADGYPRHINKTAQVLINNVLVPVIGRVSMDMITVDLTKLSQVSIGDKAVLWHKKPSAEQIAKSSETIAYELCCNAGAHAQIDYINGK